MDRISKIFNGKYSIASPKGDHRTFDIRTAKKGTLKGQRIVSLLIGPDNTNDYQGFGFVSEGGIKVWSKFRGQGTPSNHEKFAELLWSLATEGTASPYYVMGYRLLSEGKCIRCNRTLTHPDSIETGIGPECAGRWKGQ
jgi:hypothetical protein